MLASLDNLAILTVDIELCRYSLECSRAHVKSNASIGEIFKQERKHVVFPRPPAARWDAGATQALGGGADSRQI